MHHPDGSPPYDVRRADTGRVTLYCTWRIPPAPGEPTPDEHGS
ncbi:DUF1918 domain-containing protein [Streptomyces sp. NBC_01136]|nr:DUF1918 domain-containing protein [Streptomyces sp. NBC_01136]